MTIALDATYATGRHLSGVGVYSRELLLRLAELHPEVRFLHCFRPHRLLRGWRERGLYPANCSLRPLREKNQWFQAGLFHGLNQRLPAGRLTRATVTFHDLFVMTGDYSTPEFRARFTQLAEAAAARAERIVCVSRFTANQVRDLLGVEEARLRVVHHGVRFRLPGNRSPERIVLHVGAIQKRKNLALLVRAFSKAAPPDWQLVLAGGEGFGADETFRAIEQSPANARIHRTGWIGDADLERWYARAAILAFPSWDEGFGMPAIEAMANGIPVLASDRGSLPEICRQGAWILDANREDEWTEALRALMMDEEARASWASKGRAQRFNSWEEAAQQTWQVYEELLK